MPRVTLTAAERKAGVDLRDVMRPILGKAKPDQKPRRRRLPARIQKLKEARAIIAVAALHPWRVKMPGRKARFEAPNYYKIATDLGLDKKAADVADELWNAANGPDEGPETEEKALEHVNFLLTGELDS